jgi:hypothetical protein
MTGIFTEINEDQLNTMLNQAWAVVNSRFETLRLARPIVATQSTMHVNDLVNRGLLTIHYGDFVESVKRKEQSNNTGIIAFQSVDPLILGDDVAIVASQDVIPAGSVYFSAEKIDEIRAFRNSLKMDTVGLGNGVYDMYSTWKAEFMTNNVTRTWAAAFLTPRAAIFIASAAKYCSFDPKPTWKSHVTVKWLGDNSAATPSFLSEVEEIARSTPQFVATITEVKIWQTEDGPLVVGILSGDYFDAMHDRFPGSGIDLFKYQPHVSICDAINGDTPDLARLRSMLKGFKFRITNISVCTDEKFSIKHVYGLGPSEIISTDDGLDITRFHDHLGPGYLDFSFRPPMYTRLQSHMSVQMLAVRALGVFTSQYFNWSSLSVDRKYLRYLTAKKKGFTPTPDAKIDALDVNRPMLISGHAERSLLYAAVMPFSITSLIAIIEGNILMSMRNSDFLMGFYRAKRLGGWPLLQETESVYDLWHNATEYLLAAEAAAVQLRIVGLPYDHISKFTDSINQLAVLYPSFRNVTPLALRLFPTGERGKVSLPN